MPVIQEPSVAVYLAVINKIIEDTVIDTDGIAKWLLTWCRADQHQGDHLGFGHPFQKSH
jgi:hypothetical protein